MKECPITDSKVMQKWEHQRKLIIQSRKHNRRVCSCEGCKLFWMSSVGVGRSGQPYELRTIGGEGKTENEPEPYPIDLWTRDYIMALRSKSLMPERWVGINQETKEKEKIPIVAVFYKPKQIVRREA